MSMIQFPQDEGAHNTPIEWWYVNGHIESSNDEYGFAAAFFKIDNRTLVKSKLFKAMFPIRHNYDVHVSVINKKSGGFISATKSYIGFPWSTEARIGNLHTKIGKNFMKKNGKLLEFVIDVEDILLRFSATQKQNNMLHGENGCIEMGKAGMSHYYSNTNMEISGELELRGTKASVSGKAWFDHQWGNWVSNRALWNWMSLQLDNGTQIMIYRFFDENDKDINIYTTVCYRDGSKRKILKTVIKQDAYWVSKKTNLKYPVEFSVSIPGEVIYKFKVNALFKNCEMQSSLANYWEGAVSVTGSTGDIPISGSGYVESVGVYL